MFQLPLTEYIQLPRFTAILGIVLDRRNLGLVSICFNTSRNNDKRQAHLSLHHMEIHFLWCDGKFLRHQTTAAEPLELHAIPPANVADMSDMSQDRFAPVAGCPSRFDAGYAGHLPKDWGKVGDLSTAAMKHNVKRNQVGPPGARHIVRKSPRQFGISL